jgi:hypothetical protein
MSEVPRSLRNRRRALAGRQGSRSQGHGGTPSKVPDSPVDSRRASIARYLRFTVAAADDDSGLPQGLFQAAYGLRDEGLFLPHEATWFTDVVGWFQNHLAAPKDTAQRISTRAIFWFKASATEHVQRMRALAVLLKHHGIACRTLRTTKPGRIVFEDDHQVAAIPYRDSPT